MLWLEDGLGLTHAQQDAVFSPFCGQCGSGTHTPGAPCFFFFFKGRSCLQKQRKATAQACKTSGRAPPPKRRAGKGAYDMAARAHASRTGRPRRKEWRGSQAAHKVPMQGITASDNWCMAWKQRTTMPVDGPMARRGGSSAWRSALSSSQRVPLSLQVYLEGKARTFYDPFVPPPAPPELPPISPCAPASLPLRVLPFVTRDAAMRDAAPVARAATGAPPVPQRLPAPLQPSTSCAVRGLRDAAMPDAPARPLRPPRCGVLLDCVMADAPASQPRPARRREPGAAGASAWWQPYTLAGPTGRLSPAAAPPQRHPPPAS